MALHIPTPPVSGFHLGPLFVHFYGLMYVVAITLAIVITRRRWRAMGGDPSLVGDVALWAVPAGIIGGRIYFDITTPFDITPHAWYGPFAVWSGGVGGRGGGGGGGAGRRHRAGPPERRQRRRVRQRGRARAAGRPGGRADRQLFQPGTVRQADRPALGPGNRPGVPPGRVRAVHHLPADLPVRADLRPGPGRRAGLARPSPRHPPLGAVRLVRGRVFGVPDLRGVSAYRLLSAFPGPAAELLHRLSRDRRRPGLVRLRPAQEAGGRAAGAGRVGARRGSGPRR